MTIALKLKMLKQILIISMLLFTSSALAIDNEAPIKTEHKKSKYPWSIGLSGIFTLNPYKDTKRSRLLFPFIGYRGERFTFSGPYISYKIIKTHGFSLAISGFLHSDKFRPRDTSNLQMKQLNTRRYSFMTGIEAKYNLKRIGSLSARVARSIIGADGYTATGTIGTAVPIIFERSMIMIRPGLGLQWQSRKLINYYYGISSAESKRSGFNAYAPESAVIPFVSLSTMYIYKKRYSAMLTIKTRRLSDQMYNSPMVDKRFLTSIIVVLAYAF